MRKNLLLLAMMLVCGLSQAADVVVTAFATNAGWVYGTDYTIEVQASLKDGTPVETVLTDAQTAGQKQFSVPTGTTYFCFYTPSATRSADGYMQVMTTATVTDDSELGTNASAEITPGTPYVVTVPADAEYFIGYKISHFRAFVPVSPAKVETIGSQKKYTYLLTNDKQYNYRTWKANGLTQAGIFYMNADASKRPNLSFTDADYSVKSPKWIDHDPASNGKYNVADIFVNINEANHLALHTGDNYSVLPMRNWQIIESITNNYFVEPTFHYHLQSLTPGKTVEQIVSLQHTTSTTDPWNTMTAVGKGTVLVTVTYDAIAANQYAKGSATKTAFVGGEYWSAIWPENTAVFMVTVDEDAASITPNCLVNAGLNSATKKNAGDKVDAEMDVFYYAKGTAGYAYTFTPTGVTSVKMAYPTIGTNEATYSGFGTEGVTANGDGSYTVLLKHGRQVVAMYDAEGKAKYQVLTAKEVEVTLSNATRPGSQKFLAGEKVNVTFNTLYHPANKLAGIHNFMSTINYTTVGGASVAVAGTANQYNFAGTPAAQTITATLPSTWTSSDPVEIAGGTLKVTNFGDPLGNHRVVNRSTGRNPNFTAIQQTCYMGVLPVIEVPIFEANFSLRFDCNIVDANVTICKVGGSALTPKADGSYDVMMAMYQYAVSKSGYTSMHGTISVNEDSEAEIVVPVELKKLSDNPAIWDGSTKTEPAKDGSGVYLIGTGAELAWFAAQVNAGNVTYKAKLMADIDLGGFQWTAIGNNSQKFTGSLDGDGHMINNLYINATTAYQGLFGYLGTGAKVENLSVGGAIVSTNKQVAGISGYATGATISNCYNYASVTGTANVAGIVGQAAATVSITKCGNFGAITGSAATTYAAGICSASVATVTVTNVFNMGMISGKASIAGIEAQVGAAFNAVLNGAYNVGAIQCDDPAKCGAIVACNMAANSGNKATNIFCDRSYGIIAKNGETVLANAEDWKSGKAAYIIAAATNNAFGQEIGVDAYPVLGGKTVLKDGDHYYNEGKYYLVNYHLTNCNMDEIGNAEGIDKETDELELYFLPNEGYTMDGARVVVTIAGNEVVNTAFDWSMAARSFEWESTGDMASLYISDLEDYFDGDVDITIIAKAEPTYPATFKPATFEDITVGENGVYYDPQIGYGANVWTSGSFLLSTYSDQATYYSNTVVSSVVDPTLEADYMNPVSYLSAATDHAAEGSNFGVWNNNWYGNTNIKLASARTLTGMAINNTSATLNYAKDNFTNQTFSLMVSGKKDGMAAGSKVFNLIDYSDPNEIVYAENWQWLDLSTLGEVDELEFSVSCADYMAPEYFCFDNLGGNKQDCQLGQMTKSYDLPLTQGWASFCYDVDWTVEDAEVYRGVWNASAGCIDLYLVESDKIPAGEGVIVYSSEMAAVAHIHSAEGAEAIENNQFVGVNVQTTLTASNQRYVLARDDENNVAFRRYVGTTIPAHRVYMDIPAAGVAVRMRIVSATTDLEQTPYVNDDMIYDVMGREYGSDRAKLSQGIYIQNGEKFIVK